MNSQNQGQDEHPRRFPRRVSKTTDLLARFSLSPTMKAKELRPTIIMAMLYLNDADPNIDVLKQTLGERLLKLPRFSSVFSYKKTKCILNLYLTTKLT